MFDRPYLGAYDLPEGRDVIVTIEDIKQGEVQNGTKKDKKPIITLRGKEKKLICNATNAKTIARMYGNNVESWIGKRVSLYISETNSQGGEIVPCIRIRPQPPQSKQAAPEPESIESALSDEGAE